MYVRARSAVNPKRKGNFDISDTSKIKHTKVGIWDLYEEKAPELSKIPFYDFISSRFSVEPVLEIWQNAPHIWRMLVDVANIEGCWWLLGMVVLIDLIASLIPAMTLWYSSQFLTIVQTAIDHRTVDTSLLFRICMGRFVCSGLHIFLGRLKTYLRRPLNFRVGQFYSQRQIHCLARLDVPTFSDPSLKRQTLNVRGASSGIVMNTITRTMGIVTSITQLTSQLGVLIGVLRNQQDAPLLAVISFAYSSFQYITSRRGLVQADVYAATTRDEDYLKMQGILQTLRAEKHRKEIVAGNMWKYMHSEYIRCATKLGEAATEFHQSLTRLSEDTRLLSLSPYMHEILKELPQIVFVLRAVRQPSTIPLSLASLNLITSTVTSFSSKLFALFNSGETVANQWADVRKFYELLHVENHVKDGSDSFPENQKETELTGVEIEFRNVSFKYPDATSYALKNVSFKILPGQLCVIVGTNGSGKSSILKLIMRLYDIDEGEILVDGKDIRTLKLEDLRKVTAVLFQDYSLFPVSVKQNIALGDPSSAFDEDKIIEAAKLGGAHDFITRLPESYDTHLQRPVSDVYCGLPEGTKSLFGREVKYSGLRGRVHAAGRGPEELGLSGGQMQRIALSRTFMRSLVDSQSAIGLLLFDEPSASLDPAAEHDLFERLRNLRGQKTMIFSSHRFGNLTRHAGLILYMSDSAIVESGSHDDLIKHGGEYARIWNLQAQAFLS